MSVPRFLSRYLNTGSGEHIFYGGRDFTEMGIVGVGIQKRHLSRRMQLVKHVVLSAR